MEKFLEPASVALIGVPRNTGLGSFNNAETLLRYGYAGKIFPINPKAGEICGLKTYPSIADVPQPVDLAVISVGRERVIPMLDQCVSVGVKRIVVITQGFADADQKGKDMQDELKRKARANGVRILGPNTMGVLNNYKKFTTAFIDLPRPETFSPVSLIAQTGVIQVAAQNMAYKYWGKAIDIGNGCDIDVVDSLSYLARDPETRIIVIYMEGITRGTDFLNVASQATMKKPVIVFKSGRSHAGAKAALSHTGSLVGEDHVFDAVCKRSGIIRVTNGNELTDAIRALLLMGAMNGPRVGVVTVTGAGGIMAADACEEHGLTFAKLPLGLADTLTQGLPEWIPVSNPIDIWPIGMIGGNYTQSVGTALTELLRSDSVDGVLGILPVSNSPLHQNLNIVDVLESSRKKSGNNKPLSLWPYMDASSFVDKLESIAGIACFNTIEQAVQGLSFCYRYHQAATRHVPAQKMFPVDRDTLRPLEEKGRSQKILVGDEALQLLRLFGIPVVKGAIAQSREDLGTIASAMIFPLVLKVTGAKFLHKTEWGGVVTGIKNPDDLLRAFDQVIENVRIHRPDEKIEAVQIQEQLRGHEVLLGLKKDPQFGHVIACGMGGIYTEVFKDISRAITPIDKREANEMLASLTIAPILKGVRGAAGIDWEGLVEIMERLSFLAYTLSDINELDINPIIATHDTCVAVDVRIVW
jgi:acyl-CoA synthetase (NDP forming)